MNEIELWKPIKGYEGLYEISSLGRVQSFCSNSNQRYKNQPIPKILSPGRGKIRRYRHVTLFKNKISKTYSLHRLVLETFVGIRPAGYYACHHDDNPSNNKLSNLRWDTPKQNKQDAKRNDRVAFGYRQGSAHPDTSIEKIFKLSAEGYSAYATGRILKISKGCVLHNLNGKSIRGKTLLGKYKRDGVPLKTLTRKCSREADNNPNARLNWKTVEEIRMLYKTGNYSQQYLASKYKVVQNTISMIVRNKSWSVRTSTP